MESTDLAYSLIDNKSSFLRVPEGFNVVDLWSLATITLFKFEADAAVMGEI